MAKKPVTPSINEGIVATNVTAKVVAVGKNAKATLNQYSAESPQKIADAFAHLYEKIHQMPDSPDKSVAENAVKALEAEARKGDQAEESTVQKWLNFLAQTAPDVFEVALATFVNPIQGLGIAFKKVAEFSKTKK